MLSLATMTFSPSSLLISSSAGATIRHGPHHSARKSTRTGLSEPRTSSWKLASVTYLGAMGISEGVALLLGTRRPGHNPPAATPGADRREDRTAQGPRYREASPRF